MKIGIDIGGSHIGVGLVDGGIVVSKRERDFLATEKENIEIVIEKMVIKYVKEILKESNIDLNDIELIRNCNTSVHQKMEL